MSRLLCVILLLLCAASGRADQLRVAVAANFLPVIETLKPGFEAATGHEMLVSSGSTGALFAQIRHGAPFDVFLAADAARPAQLEPVVARRTIALGRLAVWAPGGAPDADRALAQARVIAIANPALAPYGAAAQQVLRAKGLWQPERVVMGQNIGQTMGVVATGNAPVGLVAAPMLPLGAPGVWAVPEALHDPIVQDGVLLNDRAAAVAFWDYLTGPIGRAAIARAGYGVPDE